MNEPKRCAWCGHKLKRSALVRKRGDKLYHARCLKERRFHFKEEV